MPARMCTSRECEAVSALAKSPQVRFVTRRFVNARTGGVTAHTVGAWPHPLGIGYWHP